MQAVVEYPRRHFCVCLLGRPAVSKRPNVSGLTRLITREDTSTIHFHCLEGSCALARGFVTQSMDLLRTVFRTYIYVMGKPHPTTLSHFRVAMSGNTFENDLLNETRGNRENTSPTWLSFLRVHPEGLGSDSRVLGVPGHARGTSPLPGTPQYSRDLSRLFLWACTYRLLTWVQGPLKVGFVGLVGFVPTASSYRNNRHISKESPSFGCKGGLCSTVVGHCISRNNGYWFG